MVPAQWPVARVRPWPRVSQPSPDERPQGMLARRPALCPSCRPAGRQGSSSPDRLAGRLGVEVAVSLAGERRHVLHRLVTTRFASHLLDIVHFSRGYGSLAFANEIDALTVIRDLPALRL